MLYPDAAPAADWLRKRGTVALSAFRPQPGSAEGRRRVAEPSRRQVRARAGRGGGGSLGPSGCSRWGVSRVAVPFAGLRSGGLCLWVFLPLGRADPVSGSGCSGGGAGSPAALWLGDPLLCAGGEGQEEAVVGGSCTLPAGEGCGSAGGLGLGGRLFPSRGPYFGDWQLGEGMRLGRSVGLRDAVGVEGGALGWGHQGLRSVSGVCSLFGGEDCGTWQGGLGRWQSSGFGGASEPPVPPH